MYTNVMTPDNFLKKWYEKVEYIYIAMSQRE